MSVEINMVDKNGELKKIKPIVYINIEVRVKGKKLPKLSGDSSDSNDGQVILDGACGAIRPGRLAFILGPSGAGKTTLLKILAGRKKTGVKGSIEGSGRKEAVLVSQHANLIDSLTTFETLKFAARLKLPNASKTESMDAIKSVAKQLGILDAFHTRAGHLSGGERKRLTVACELLTDPYFMLLDEPTSGLDSVSSMSVIKALRTVAMGGRTVACVIHQPSSKLYSSADDVLLLASGRTVYAGARTNVPATLATAGFTCPPFYNMADYLLEVASGEHAGSLATLESEAKNYAIQMRAVDKTDINDNGKGAETENLLHSIPIYQTKYEATFCQQFRATLWRCGVGCIRDVFLTQIRLACHVIVALLLGALYSGAGADAARIVTNTSCVFFFLLFLFFSNAMPTIQSFPNEATVVLQEHLNKWYSLSAYCIAKLLVDLPVQILCASVFIFPVWYITEQPLEVFRIAMVWLLCLLITILAQNFGMVIGTACGVKMGLFVVPATNIPMVMFSEFFIPYKEMPVYLRPLSFLSYFRYAFDGILRAVYDYDRGKLPCSKEFCMFRRTSKYLEELGLSSSYGFDVIMISAWIIVLQICFVILLHYKAYKACR